VETFLFDYFLPAERIAQEARPRGTSRLLVLDRETGRVMHCLFADLPGLLRRGDVLVRNDVRVRPARLYGTDPEGRLVEILLLEPAGTTSRWIALAKPGRRAKAGRSIAFSGGLSARVEEVREDGKRVVGFDRQIQPELLDRIGHVPLPPYIRRVPGAADRPEDREAYQTVFAREPLAVAAPTAGLHFTPEILDRIRAAGIAIADLTLAVGAGTFKPVVVEEVERHLLESEEVRIPPATAEAVSRARRDGGRVVAVGTTVTRALEAAARLPGGIEAASAGAFRTDLFITPGFEFRVVDALLTNFHLPRSTLLMLVCAFAGREHVLAAYEQAIRAGYLFYSYGDAMFVTPKRGRPGPD
jgi:S-adenosylmethionine:tRNA ribosyltransferase-isomerase